MYKSRDGREWKLDIKQAVRIAEYDKTLDCCEKEIINYLQAHQHLLHPSSDSFDAFAKIWKGN